MIEQTLGQIKIPQRIIKTPFKIAGAGGGLLPVDANFVEGITRNREKLTRSGITNGQEVAENCDYFFHLKEGQILADLGCGPGLISCHLTSRLGDTGWTYCLDASEAMLNKAASVLFGKRTTLYHGDIHVVDKIIPEKVDAVILSGNVHLLDNRLLAFNAIKNILKPDGKMVIVTHAYFLKRDSKGTNFFSNQVDVQREINNKKIEGLRLPMLSEGELYSIINTIHAAGLNISAYERDTGSTDSATVCGFPPDKTIIDRLKVTNPGFPENAARSVAFGILSEVYRGRQAQIYLLCTKRNTFVSKPNR